MESTVAGKICPAEFRDEGAVRVELLDAAIESVRNIDFPGGVQRDASGTDKLAVGLTETPELAREFAIGTEFLYAVFQFTNSGANPTPGCYAGLQSTGVTYVNVAGGVDGYTIRRGELTILYAQGPEFS